MNFLEAAQFAIAYNPKGVGDALIQAGYRVPSYEPNQLYSIVYHAYNDGENIAQELQAVPLPNPSSVSEGGKPFWETTFGQVLTGLGTSLATGLSGALENLFGSNSTPPPPDNTNLILGLQKNMFYMVLAIVVVLLVIILKK